MNNKKIVELMAEKGIGVNELARRTGMSKSSISRITRGLTSDCRISNARAIAWALGCSVFDIIND